MTNVRRPHLSRVLLVQGAYYVLTGGWAAARPSSFERVAGRPLNQLQLSVTGSLFVAVGVTLAVGARRGPVPEPVRVLAVLTPFAAVQSEVRHCRDLPPVLVVDLIAEAVLAAAVGCSRKEPER